MTGVHLPAPVVTLVAAGRRVIGSALLHELHDRPPTTTGPAPVVTAEYALRHGMLTWVAGSLPPELVLAHMARCLDGVRQLLEIVDRFERHGIEFVALKGPAFSQWLYGNAAARRFSDLDVLVSSDTRDAARGVLEQIGYERRIPSGPGDLVYASIGAWPMTHKSDLPVDLHWTLAGRRFSQALHPPDVLRDAVALQLGGRAVTVPRPEHAAVMTLMHSAKHLWYALELPFSIAALARRTDIDWQAVRDLTARAGALRGAAAGLALAGDLFAVEVPAPFRADTALSDVRELCRCALRTLALPPGEFADRRLERRMQLLAFDRRTDRLRYDLRRLTEPTRAEWEWVPLPSRLAPLYWPARLVRLALMAMTGSGGARDTRI